MVLDGKSSQEYSFNAGVSQSSILAPTLFVLYINNLPDVTCNVAIYADDTTLYSKCGYIKNWLLNLNLIHETPWTGAGSGLLISMLENFNLFCLTGLITLLM